jgi:hypothetical protein
MLCTFSELAIRTVCVLNVMFEVKLVYNPEPYSLTLKESITYCATVDLFLRGIHTAQTSASRIAFESERDRTLGILYLSGSTSFTPICIDDSGL